MIFRNGNPFRSELPNDHDVVLDGTIEFKGGVDGTARGFEDGDLLFERRIDQLGEAGGSFWTGSTTAWRKVAPRFG